MPAAFDQNRSAALPVPSLPGVSGVGLSVVSGDHHSLPPFLGSDVGSNASEIPTLESATNFQEAQTLVAGRFELLERIARGGMGTIYRARDRLFNRILAVKVMRSRYQDHPDLIRRFMDEAQIDARLQHPGIVPVYEVGTLSDGRPFIAMKLVAGRTLGELLKGRKHVVEDLSKYLNVFVQLCQTVAYAHSQGVIHRDLKPDNVMVGGFGEVQLMDWGLAKTIRTTEWAPDKVSLSNFIIPTTESASDSTGEILLDGSTPSSDATCVLDAREKLPERDDGPRFGSQLTDHGRVLGTFQFMPPEQARGEVDNLDERCDVFALGAILHLILTGEHLYAGSIEEIRCQATTGDLQTAFARLDLASTDPMLVTLAKHCLSPILAERPFDAAEVASAVAQHLADVQDGIRLADMEQAAQIVRSEEAIRQAETVRRYRGVIIGMFATVLIPTVILNVYSWVRHREAQSLAHAHTRRVESQELARIAMGDVRERLDRRFVPVDQLAQWTTDIHQAETHLRATESHILTDLSDDLRNELDIIRTTIERARRECDFLTKLHTVRLIGITRPDRAARYATAFRECGFDVLNDPDVAVKLADLHVRSQVTIALDDWLAATAGGPDSQPLCRVLDAIDPTPTPLRAKLRDALQANSPTVAAPLLTDANAMAIPPILFVALAETAGGGALQRDGLILLEEQCERHAKGFWLPYLIGVESLRVEPPRVEQAVRHLSVAAALRPMDGPVAVKLGEAWLAAGNREAAFRVFALAVQADAGLVDAQVQLGIAQIEKHNSVAAETAFRAALASRPNDVSITCRLAEVLNERGAYGDAVQLLRPIATAEAVSALFARSLRRSGNPQEAISVCDTAIAAHPETGELYRERARAYAALADRASALRDAKHALLLDPQHGASHALIGRIEMDAGRFQSAERAYRTAVRLQPGMADHHDRLGILLETVGDLAGAVPEYLQAVRLANTVARYRYRLGQSYAQLNRNAEALAELREAERLFGPDAPQQAMIQEDLRTVAEQLRLSTSFDESLLTNPPSDRQKRLAMARVCAYEKSNPIAAAHLYRSVGETVECHQASIAWMLHTLTSDVALDDATRLKLSEEAREWLRSDLEAASKLGSSSDIGSVRSSAAMLARTLRLPFDRLAGRVPDFEEQAWQHLRAEAERIRKTIHPDR